MRISQYIRAEDILVKDYYGLNRLCRLLFKIIKLVLYIYRKVNYIIEEKGMEFHVHISGVFGYIIDMQQVFPKQYTSEIFCNIRSVNIYEI